MKAIIQTTTMSVVFVFGASNARNITELGQSLASNSPNEWPNTN
jgi:hypothetical protein